MIASRSTCRYRISSDNTTNRRSDSHATRSIPIARMTRQANISVAIYIHRSQSLMPVSVDAVMRVLVTL